MNWIDIVIISVLAIAVITAIAVTIRHKNPCCGNCKSCVVKCSNKN